MISSIEANRRGWYSPDRAENTKRGNDADDTRGFWLPNGGYGWDRTTDLTIMSRAL